MNNDFKFEISLSVLNHLGRNLYRSIITIIAEAISNSWDADAKNVWITLDRDNDLLIIKDDGIGMDDIDFQNNFLKVGYSKRKNNNHRSLIYKRPYIGRKGIGKLALLSCAETIEILSKKRKNKIIGGIINNNELDDAIKDDTNANEYNLKDFNKNDTKFFNGLNSGTILIFNKLNEKILHSEIYFKKLIMLYFNFSIYDNNFNIYFNNELLDEKQLFDLSENTQFLWKFNSYSDPYIKSLKKLEHKIINNLKISKTIKGYIATTKKPSNLKVSGTEEKVSVDLFVNGRLREKDILKHIPSARIVENYMYGRIYVDSFDDGKTDDIFTSNRESIIANSVLFNKFLENLKPIINKIIFDWDKFRCEINETGDEDNTRLPIKSRRALELFNVSLMDNFITKKNIKQSKILSTWISEIRDEAIFNVPSYTDCFISENILRKYIKNKKIKLNKKFDNIIADYKERSKKSANKANISFSIRQKK